jgi:integrase
MSLPAVLPFPTEGAFQSVKAAQPRRTVTWVIDWFLKNDTKMQNREARKERARVLGLFCAHRNTDGRPVGDAFTDECIGADLVEFLSAHPGAKARWTRKRWIATIKRPFNFAARLGLIPGCPFSGVTAPKGKRGRDVSPEEFQAMLREATPAFRRVLIFLRWSGARPAELRALEWPQVRELASAIVQGEHKTSTTLTDARPRRIQLNRVLLKLLAWIKRRSVGKFVFVNHFGGVWTTRALCKNLEGIRTRANLDPSVKNYGCRHAYATGAILNGVDVATLAELMGHASVITTQWYLHLAGKSDHLQAAAERAVQGRGRSPKG